MKLSTTSSLGWFGFGTAVLMGVAAIGASSPSAISAQAAGQTPGEVRREERRDTLQDTFTGWDQLGSVRVEAQAADHRINVATGADASDRVRVRVETGSLVVERLVITYVNGQRYEAPANITFSDENRTHEIDLPGTPRAIRRVVFHTSNLPEGQTAQVEVWSH